MKSHLFRSAHRAWLVWLSLLIMPAVAQAQAEFAFTTNADNTLSVRYYNGSGGNVTIPAVVDGRPVTSIGNQAFCRCGSLTSITIPDSVTSLEDGGWAPNMVEWGYYYGAFYDCYNLTNVTLGNGLQRIGNYAFGGCGRLTGITFSNSVTWLGDHAFEFCTGLTNVRLWNGLAVIGRCTFASCTSLTDIDLPASITTIYGGYAIDLDLRQIIYFGAFRNCTSLRGIYFRGHAPYGGSDPYLCYGADDSTVYYLPGSAGWEPTFGGRPTAMWQPRMDSADGNIGGQTNFGFNINWASGQTVIVEACTNVTAGNWLPLQTNVLTGDTLYFSDPKWTNFPCRFYRVRSP